MRTVLLEYAAQCSSFNLFAVASQIVIPCYENMQKYGTKRIPEYACHNYLQIQSKMCNVMFSAEIN